MTSDTDTKCEPVQASEEITYAWVRGYTDGHNNYLARMYEVRSEQCTYDSADEVLQAVYAKGYNSGWDEAQLSDIESTY